MQSIPTCEQAEQLFVIGALDPSAINENMGGTVENQCGICGNRVFIGRKLYEIIENPKSEDLVQIVCKPCSAISTGG